MYDLELSARSAAMLVNCEYILGTQGLLSAKAQRQYLG